MRILRYILLTLTFTTTLLFSNDLTQEQINAYVDSLGFSEKYYNIHNVKKQKSAFISELMPKIEAENHKIEQEFFTISQILEKSYFEMSHEDKMDLAKISKKYVLSEYPIQYYFEFIEDKYSSFCPGIDKKLGNQPYFIFND